MRADGSTIRWQCLGRGEDSHARTMIQHARSCTGPATAVVSVRGGPYVLSAFLVEAGAALSSSSACSSIRQCFAATPPALEIVRMTRVPTHLALATIALLLVACDESAPPTGETTATPAAAFATAAAKGGSAVELLNRSNSTLATRRKDFRI